MKYFSQIGQDQYYIENIIKYKKNGFFLDIGANNGIHDSNTATLEFFYEWTGICIEANPFLIEDLKKNRPYSKVANYAAWFKDDVLDLEVTSSNNKGIRGDLLSRININNRNDNYFKQHFIQDKTNIQVKAKKVTEILRDFYDFPLSIDYCSIDIEGSEMEALNGIDFNKIDIKFMTIEHGDRPGYKEKICEYLANYGYILHRINKWDIEFTK